MSNGRDLEETSQGMATRVAVRHPPGFEADVARTIELSKRSENDSSALNLLSQMIYRPSYQGPDSSIDFHV